MKVAVLEYLAGGGLVGSSAADPQASALFAPLLREGLSMLTALVDDLTACGHEVHVCLTADAASSEMVLALCHRTALLRVHKTSCDWMQCWTEVAQQSDRTIVIAPELHRELERIISKLRTAGANVVASSESFLQSTSDKLIAARLMQAAQVPHPETETLAVASNRSLSGFTNSSVSQASDPVVLKRRDGAGCVDMKYFESGYALNNWLQSQMQSELQVEDWIVQRWHPGTAASLAIIADESWSIVGAMHQEIRLDRDDSFNGDAHVSYLGGSGPLVTVPSEKLKIWVEQIRSALPSCAMGWIGIDFVIPPLDSGTNDLVFIEVNPRLTTSYLGYRKWFGHELAECLLGTRALSELQRLNWLTLDRVAFEAN